MDKKLSAAQQTALLKAAADFRGHINATRSTWAALEKRGYAVKCGSQYYDWFITPAGIEAVGLTIEAVLLKQARAKLIIMQESEGRMRLNASGWYKRFDLEEAMNRVSKAEFELAALECAIG